MTAGYPSESDIYNKAFVHTRVKYYRENGLDVQVFLYNRSKHEAEQYEFEGVPVTVGDDEVLDALTAGDRVEKLLFHFQTIGLGPLLARQLERGMPTVVWFHGYGADGWHRRWWEHIDSPMDLRDWVRGRAEHNRRTRDFFQEFLGRADLPVHSVFVSAWFRDHVFGPDMGIIPVRSSIINNPIDTHRFSYHPPAPEARNKILLLRPFDRRFYGNDLAVAAIEKLSRKSWFSELEFTVAGEGQYWDELTARVAQFDNVSLRHGFIPQREIPALHREHGVFLVPSRKDTQGVSRDEAMSSGLVPVTNDVDAISEFVTHRRDGWLAPTDDVDGLAEGIEILRQDISLFHSMSAAAAVRVRQERSLDIVGPQEVSLIAETPVIGRQTERSDV
ncbi:hypothetical protein BJH93_09125 [Kocuria polaris]|nr:hypothetical protein [Kocuria polaris]